MTSKLLKKLAIFSILFLISCSKSYTVDEISKAVDSVNEKLQGGFSVLGEADHPEELTVNLDRVSHMITEMWMDGKNGFGKLKIIPTPMGNIVQTLLDSGAKLGVSSRGSGNVTGEGKVSDFESSLFDYLDANASGQLKVIRDEGIISDENAEFLDKAISDFKNSFKV